MKKTHTTAKIVLIAAILLFLFITLAILGWCHWKNTSTPIFMVTSNSMAPYIPKNSLVLINNRWGDDLNNLIGRPIAFYNPLKKKILVHRVVSVDGDLVSTKGDYNHYLDNYQPGRKDIIGYVEHSIEYFYILVFGLLFIIVLLIIIYKNLPDQKKTAH